MSNLFFYQREVSRKVKVEKPEEGKPTEKDVVETYWDCFNIDKVIRGHWTSNEIFTIMLDDGHEQTDTADNPVFDNKGKLRRIDKVKTRDWYMSQVPLRREDALRFRATVEARVNVLEFSGID